MKEQHQEQTPCAHHLHITCPWSPAWGPPPLPALFPYISGEQEPVTRADADWEGQARAAEGIGPRVAVPKGGLWTPGCLQDCFVEVVSYLLLVRIPLNLSSLKQQTFITSQ